MRVPGRCVQVPAQFRDAGCYHGELGAKPTVKLGDRRLPQSAVFERCGHRAVCQDPCP